MPDYFWTAAAAAAGALIAGLPAAIASGIAAYQARAVVIRQARLDAVAETATLIGQLSGEVSSLRGRCDQLLDRWVECERKHGATVAELGELKARLGEK